MDGARRRAESSLAERLEAEGHAFDFFQAVRMMLRLLPDRAPVGGGAKPQKEFVRFQSRVTLEFPASSIHEIRTNAHDGRPPEMIVGFMGLMGTQGVLPFFYTEWMIQRELHKDSAMAAFFDLFNHRWISLFYKAWEKHRLPINLERSALGEQSGPRLSQFVYSFAGLNTAGLQNRLRVEDSTLVYYSGLIAQRPMSAAALRGILRDYFGLPFEITQFCGAWYRLDQSDRCFLDKQGISNELGVGAVLGDVVWDPQSLFEVRVGPLTYHEFQSFLPNGAAAGKVTDLVRILVGATTAFRLRLVLQGNETPAAKLLDDTVTQRLGWDIWLGEVDGGDIDDAVFEEAA